MAMFSMTFGNPYPQTTPIFVFFLLPFISLYWVKIETSYLVYRLIVASPSRWTTNRPWKGRFYVTWHVLNFGGPINISGMAVKFCIEGDYTKSCQKDDKSSSKGCGYVHVTNFFVCTTVDLEKILSRHAVSWDQQCSRRRTIVYLTFDGRC